MRGERGVAVLEERANGLELVDRIAISAGQRYTLEQLAAGFTAIANANMAAPIKKISIARGYDVRDYLLVSFGGAGAQHACAIARDLGIKKILQHPYAGVLSAFGIGMADVKKFAACDVSRRYSLEQLQALEPLFHEMEVDLIRQVRDEGIPNDRIGPAERLLEMRYVGQDATIPITCPDDGDYRKSYTRLHRQLYGYVHEERTLEITAARVEVVGTTSDPPLETTPPSERTPVPTSTTPVTFSGRSHQAAVFLRVLSYRIQHHQDLEAITQQTFPILPRDSDRPRLIHGAPV